jgi:2-methylisocitrate lyase-like PEP mutase family enzyme
LPVIADADTGYGGVNNLLRTVEDYIQAGVAAIHLEDQTLPKRCGQLGGIRLVDAADQARRLKGAVRAREGSDLLLIARTDALGVSGMDEAVNRAKRYADTGVDLVFIDGVKTLAQVEAIARQLDAPKVLSIVDGNETAQLRAQDIEAFGFQMVFYALTTLFAAAKASASVLEQLKHKGTTYGARDQLATYDQFMTTVGLQRFHDFEHDYG